MGTISIIIVTYNSENEISDCIDSIITTFKIIDFEIVIADNNSTDNTISLIETINTNKITLIKNAENLGYTKANNQCLKTARGNYILFLNPDTILRKDSIQLLVHELEEKNELAAVAPQLQYPNGTIQRSCRRFPRRRDVLYETFGLSRIFNNSKEFNHWKMGDFDHATWKYVKQPAGAAILVKKNVIDEIGFLDEQFPMFFSDVDICKRIWDTGYNIKFIPSAKFTHLGGTSIFQNRTKMIITSHLSFWKYFKKYRKSSIESLNNLLIGIVLLILVPIRIAFNYLIPNSLKTIRRSL